MRKEKRSTQRDYESAYVWMRRGITFEWLITSGRLSAEAVNAADYSYQAKDNNLHGWSSNLRHSRFLQIRGRVLTRREVYPF